MHAVKNEKHFDHQFDHEIKKSIESNSDNIEIEVLDKPITLSELLKTTSNLKNKKACGLDYISNEMIKCSVHTLGDLILKLFNTILNSTIFPKQWCEGFILPIFKSGDPFDPTNYRGITISSCLGKLFTKILNTRLVNFLIANGIIHRSQIGFMPKHRTADHLLLLKTLIDSCKQSRKKLFICFVDLKKAFDTISRHGLIYKLLQLKLSTKFIQIVKNMYQDVTACIKTKKGLTTNFPINVGTKQGCNLSPTLFNLFINDLPTQFDNECKPVSINKNELSCLMYADDLVIFSKSEIGMKNCLKSLESYCNKWRLTVSIKKTKIMVINCPKEQNYNFQIYKNKIEVVGQYKYLGLLISNKGNFKLAIEELSSKATRAYNALKKEFNFYNGTQPKTIIKLFESMIQPILLYCCEIWGLFGWRKNDEKSILNYLFKQKHVFESLHAKLCKNALGVHRKTADLMAKAELGRFPLVSVMFKNVYSYWQHIIQAKKDSQLHDTIIHLIQKDREGQTNFYTRLKSLLAALGHCSLIYECHPSKIKANSNTLRRAYCTRYEKYFLHTLQQKAERQNSGGRFSVYYKIKKNYHFEKYLHMKNCNLRRNITSIRISTHCLPIENLRKYNVERINRTCLMCKDNEIGSEIHTILFCKNPDIVNLRNKLFENVNKCNHQWELLGHENKFLYLVLAVDETVTFYFSIFLEKLFELIKIKELQRKL